MRTPAGRSRVRNPKWRRPARPGSRDRRRGCRNLKWRRPMRGNGARLLAARSRVQNGGRHGHGCRNARWRRAAPARCASRFSSAAPAAGSGVPDPAARSEAEAGPSAARCPSLGGRRAEGPATSPPFAPWGWAGPAPPAQRGEAEVAPRLLPSCPPSRLTKGPHQPCFCFAPTENTPHVPHPAPRVAYSCLIKG